MTKEELSQRINKIIGETYSGIYERASEILLLSAEFYDRASDEIKAELHKLGRAGILLKAHSKLLDSIRNATQNEVLIRVSVDTDIPHHYHEENNNVTLKIHTGDIHLDKQLQPLISREKEIAQELMDLNVDYTMLISWLRTEIENKN